MPHKAGMASCNCPSNITFIAAFEAANPGREASYHQFSNLTLASQSYSADIFRPPES